MNWDARLDSLGIKYTSTPNAKWSLLSAVYQDETEAQGNHIILFNLQDAQGKPSVGIRCLVDWVGRDPGDVPTQAVTDNTGTANVPIYANLDITKKNGPYFAYVESQTVSDVVLGLGLPEHHHVNFLLTFGPKVAGQPPSQTLEQAVLAAAGKYTWMPINTEAALYKYAQAQGLGYPQTDEFQFTYLNDSYIGQVFNGGIVYVKNGDWANVKWVKKSPQ